MDHVVRGPILEDVDLTVQAPASFFCPLNGCLITEPVRLQLKSSSQTFDRRSLQEWFRQYPGVDPLTGQALDGWSIISSDDAMAAKLRAWADAHAFNLEAVTQAACHSPKSPRSLACAGFSSCKRRNVAPCALCGISCSPSGSMASTSSFDLDMPLDALSRSMSLPRSLRA